MLESCFYITITKKVELLSKSVQFRIVILNFPSYSAVGTYETRLNIFYCIKTKQIRHKLKQH